MKKFLQKKLKDQKGMTLIELLAVIVIIAIIAAIAIPAISNIIENSRVGAMKSDATNALNAANIYLADNPNYFTEGTTPPTEITQAQLVPGYFDGSDAFTEFKITEGANGLVFSGEGEKSGVELDVTTATKQQISAYPNNSRDAVTTTTPASSIQAK
ncbi:prepilin-type N-terminal cleavage/methylation domain-containing protein [Planococcus plakortidis]